MPVVPPGNGLVEVIVGGVAVIVRLNGDGPALPAELVAVTLRVLTPLTLGVPVSNPAEFKEAHPGRPVADHVIVAVPFAVNW